MKSRDSTRAPGALERIFSSSDGPTRLSWVAHAVDEHWTRRRPSSMDKGVVCWPISGPTTWAQVVGADIAQHTTPLSMLDGRLLVQCSSTAWATQLNLVGPSLLETIKASAPGALVESLDFIGPAAPSWKRGLRTISNGRGPRDTYG